MAIDWKICRFGRVDAILNEIPADRDTDGI